MPASRATILDLGGEGETDEDDFIDSVSAEEGGPIEFPARRVLAFLKELDLEGEDVVLKSDQEAAMLDLLNNIVSRRPAVSKVEAAETDPQTQGLKSPGVGRGIPESSPVESSASNGFIERGIQSVEGQARTVNSALENHIGTETPSDHDIIPWMIEYASVLLNRCHVVEDGKTRYDRLKGKKASHPDLEFLGK